MVACLFNCIATEDTNYKMHLVDILWALYFLKQNPTEQVGAHFCGCSPTTYCKCIWHTIGTISWLHVVHGTCCCSNIFEMPTLTIFCRLIGKIISILITVNRTNFGACKQTPLSPGWQSFKLKCAAVQYKIGISITTGWIVWINGLYPARLYSNSHIAIKCILLNSLQLGKKVIVDSGYHGHNDIFVRPRGVDNN